MKIKGKKPEMFRTQERVKKAVLDASNIMRYPPKHSRKDKPMVHVRNRKVYLILNKRYCTASVVLDLRDDWSKQWVYKLLGRKSPIQSDEPIGISFGLGA